MFESISVRLRGTEPHVALSIDLPCIFAPYRAFHSIIGYKGAKVLESSRPQGCLPIQSISRTGKNTRYSQVVESELIVHMACKWCVYPRFLAQLSVMPP